MQCFFTNLSLSPSTPTDAKIDHNLITPELMAKYLEEEILAGDRYSLKSVQHCSTCLCAGPGTVTGTATDVMGPTTDAFHLKAYSIGTQTVVQGETNNSLCLRCNSNLNSPSRGSPFIMRRRQGVGQPAKEEGSTMAEEGDNQNNVSMPRMENGTEKEKELQVNPILGHAPLHHHRNTTSANVSNGGPPGSIVNRSTSQRLVDQSRAMPGRPHSISAGTQQASHHMNNGGVGSDQVADLDPTAATEAVSFNNALIKNIKVRWFKGAIQI